ncbi:MAG: SpoIIE family protein phosphatase [Planctomycetaceae bacterium]|nr:SpoIIE family protein phosphatase [Planctomycetota bacterium]NUN51795.1 SpoIIE family protein phosphatase [Planctomycetaceae bacterium]
MSIRRDTGVVLPDDDARRRGDTFADFLTGDATRDSRNVNILLQTIAAVNSNLELEPLIVNVVDLTLELTGAERGILLLFEGDHLKVRMARDARRRNLPPNISFSHSVPAKVAREGKAICLLDAAAQGALNLGQSIADLKLLTVMCVPLRVKDRIIGCLYVDSHATSKEFSTADLTLLNALAYQVAITLDNARLLEHYVEKQRIQQGLFIARDIQRALLPPGPLDVPNFDVYGVSVGCEETSGDYFDYIRLGEERVGLVVGDVAGHGIGAAMFMATARALLRAFLHATPDPAVTLGNLNDFLSVDMETGRFMTLFYADLDPASRTLHYVRAGHNPPLLYRRGADRFEELEAPGVALGMVRGFRFRAAGPVKMEPGDILFLYTDGIVETMNPAKDQYGVERAAELLRSHRDRPAREICDALRKDVDAFGDHQPQQDDLTMIVARAK